MMFKAFYGVFLYRLHKNAPESRFFYWLDNRGTREIEYEEGLNPFTPQEGCVDRLFLFTLYKCNCIPKSDLNPVY